MKTFKILLLLACTSLIVFALHNNRCQNTYLVIDQETATQKQEEACCQYFIQYSTGEPRLLNNFDNSEMYIVGRAVEQFNELNPDNLYFINYEATDVHGRIIADDFGLWRAGDGSASDFWDMLDSMRLHHK